MKKKIIDEVTDYVVSNIKKGKGKSSKQLLKPPIIKHAGKGLLKTSRSVYQVIADELSSKPLEQLPQLPERKRDFAFRYATEHRTRNDWAKIFHVSVFTIDRWRKDPHVMKYYLIVRNQRQVLMLERLSNLEKKAYGKLSEILDLKVNDDNIDSLRKAILDVLSLTKDGTLRREVVNNNNLQLNLNQSNTNVYTKEIKTEDLKNKINELDLIESEINKD